MKFKNAVRQGTQNSDDELSSSNRGLSWWASRLPVVRLLTSQLATANAELEYFRLRVAELEKQRQVSAMSTDAPAADASSNNPEPITISLLDDLAVQFGAVLKPAQAATADVVALLDNGNYERLAANSPALKNYNWHQYIDLSLARMVRVGHCLQSFGKPGQRVLDFGSYFGNYSLLARRLGFDVDALDSYSDYAPAFESELELMRRAGVNVIDSSHNRNALDGLGDDYDFVLLLGVIEHIPHTPRELLAKILARLKPGGYLIVDTPNMAYAYWREKLNAGVSVAPSIEIQFDSPIPFEGHHREYVMSELEWIFGRVGLTTVWRDWFNYSLYCNETLTGRDARLFREMLTEQEKRECLFICGKK